MTGNDTDGVRREVESFLYREAELLDAREFREWLDLLTEDITYVVPTQVHREIDDEVTFEGEGFIFNEDLSTLESRIERFETEYAWSEKPPSRSRRIVGNVRVNGAVESSGHDELDVVNNVVLYRYKGDETEPKIITGKREDRLRRTPDGLRIARRKMTMDQTVVSMTPLSLFL